MADYTNLKNSIRSAIKANGNNEITGNLLQQILIAMVSNLGAAFQFAGRATQSTNPGTPDYNVAYLAGPGTYQNMGGAVVPSGYIGVLTYNGSWDVQLISVGGSGSSITFNSLPNGTTVILVDGVPQAVIPSQYTLLKLSAFTTTPSGLADGSFYYNTSDKKIYQKRDPTVAVIPYYDGAIYTYNNALYVWNGTDLVNVGGGGSAGFLTEPDDLALVPAAQQGDPSVLKFADRSYNSQNPNGMGYKILRKDATFASQVTETNTIYEIRYDFDLGNTTVSIPSGCVLKFFGGSVSNGTINLNGDCKVIGRGICCDISNPSENPIPLSCYLADISDTLRNRNVVQALLDSGAPVIIDYPSLTFDDELEIEDSATIISATGNYIYAELNFPDSRGFVFSSSVLVKDIIFRGLKVNSSGHCFDLCNSNENNFPTTIYHAIFENLELDSANGNCIHGGNNGKGSAGDSLIFDSKFINVNVRALNGAGFVGLLSNTLLFQKCSCHGCGVAFFVNCNGFFDSCNGTWGNTTPSFLKGNYISGTAIAIRAIFQNCNFENFASSIIDCPSANIYTSLNIQSCTIYPPNRTLDFYLFNIAQLDRLVFLSNIIGNIVFDSSHTEWYIGNPLNQNSKIISDIPLNATDRNNAQYVYPPFSTLLRGTFIQSANFNKDIFLYEDYRDTEHLRVCEFLLKPKEQVVDDTIILNLSGATRHYKLKVASNDTERNIVLQYVTIASVFGNSLQRIGIEFYVENTNANASYVLYHGLAYATGFISITGENIVLAPGEAARCVWYQGSKCLVYPATASVNAMRRVGTTSDRPTTPYKGFTYFDTTDGKMIVWNGSAWVNMDGTALS